MRRQIARDFCRTILWLDDEIKPEASESAASEPYRSFFHPITVEFQKSGLLCHLKGFPQIAGDDDPYATNSEEIGICQRLASSADIIILDWHLGSKDPAHSSKIINGLVTSGGTRFVIVLSQEPNLSTEFESAFGDVFKQSETGWYRNDKGQFVFLLSKAAFREAGSGERLLDTIYEELAVVYPDYLHWTAIEIAARIKKFSPSWLAGLPADTDLAILTERIHSTENIGHAVIENLLEDLKEAINFHSVESADASALSAAEWPKAVTYKEGLERDIAALKKDRANEPLVSKIRSLLPLGSDKEVPIEDDAVIGKVLKGAATVETIIAFQTSINQFGDFSEVRSVLPDSTTPIRSGSVFQSIDAHKAAEIWVCISQSCDCQWSNSLLFLRGYETAENNGGIGATFLRFRQKQYIFRPAAFDLKTIELQENPRMLAGFRQVGILREVAVTRLISRFWAHTTRVGINQPKMIRDSRKER